MLNLFRRVLGAVLLLGLVAGCGARKRASALEFAAYGDCRTRTEIHRRLCREMVASGAKFTLVTGDLVETPENPKAWDEFREITRELRSKPYDCAIGDHDGGTGELFLKELGQSRTYYDRKEGDVHIFVLDSRGKFAEREQLEWLEKTAGASTAKHKFAVFHHPPFMIDRDRGKEADVIRPNIHPLLVKLKFCAAFCGHQHAFYTTRRDGVRYVVTAGGGAHLWKIDPSLGQAGDLSRKFYHFVGFKISGPKIEGHVYDEDGVEDESLAFPLCEHAAGP